MPRRDDIEKILLIGSGPIVIGQAAEFDYSGVQACKVLLEEGYEVVLVNSNPATIMTDPEMADAIYIEPINWRTVARIIERERPDALLPTMGGQTALNCALDLVREGVRSVGPGRVLLLGFLSLAGRTGEAPVETEYALLCVVEGERLRTCTAYASHADAEEAAADA